MKTRRALLVQPGRFELEQTDIFPHDDEVLVKVASCGLCNWELNHWKGILGDCPQTLGHEWSGTVVELGKAVTRFKLGDQITILPDRLAGFSDYAVVGEANTFKLGNSVDPVYALGEPLKCIITVLRGAAPEAGDVGVVLGCGPMGLWCIQALAGKLLSALIAVDVDDVKLDLARRFGASHTVNPRQGDARAAIAEISGGHMADFVIEGTGIPGVLNDAIAYTRSSGRGRVLLMSAHEEATSNLDLREAVKRSIEIRVTHPGYSIDQHDDMRRAIAFLNNGTFCNQPLISHVFALEDIQTAFETLERKPRDYIKGMVRP